MMADRRRRSPEVSSSRRKESRRSEYDEQQSRAGMRSGAESIYSSSSSSFEIIDISHSFPPNRSGLKTFFTAPSERRLRKRRSSRVLRHSNSSSESVGDLAYGHGYLRRPKRMVRSRKGKEIDRERHGERERERERYTERYSDREREKSGIGRVTTDAEILAVGAGLAKLARDQNKFDLKNTARNGKQVYAAKEFGRRDEGPSRGLEPSKISHAPDKVDEEGWESASDAESISSVDSKLAFGAESQGRWDFFGRKKYTPQSRKNSVVDPRLFGPANSLHGVVTQPVGFGEVYWNSSSDFGQHPFTVPPPQSVISGSQPSLQHVYPIATEDSARFEVGRSSVASGPEPYISSRPEPIPIQQPQPITPVSQSVYEPIYASQSETGTGILKKTPTSSSRGKSLAEAALFGVAGAAVGAAISSDRKVDRKERRRDGDRDTREEDRTPKRRDSERKENGDDRKRDKKDSPDRDERKEKRRDKERTKDSPDDRNVKKREKRRDDGREETRDERHERRREERRTERGDDRYDDRRSERSNDRYESRRTKSETSVSQVSVDPFQYQVDDDAFATPNNEPATGHTRVKSVPTVVTVDREPDFTRKRSSSIKDVPVSSKSEPGKRDYADGDERDSRGRDLHRDSRDRPLHEAESIYQQAEHFTAPIDAAAISAAIAAEGYRESRSERRRDERRGERRSDYDAYDYKPRDNESKKESKDYEDYDRKSRDRDSTRESKRERARDPIQEEADRAYREIVMARKIASQVIRSRTPSPNRSVIDKYELKEEEEEVIRIVTPPGMDDHKKKGLYDAPNADFQLDHVLEDPREIRRFSLPSSNRDRSNPEALYLMKDPDASQPRPLLNLVLPTPSPSPMPEKQVARSEPARPSQPKVEIATTAASDVVSGPKGDVVPSSSASTVSKGVTWGENETKHFEVESPSEHRDEFVSNPEKSARDAPVKEPKTSARDSPVELPKSNGSKRSGWGAIAAGIVGASAGAAAANPGDTSKTPKSSNTKENEDAAYEYRGVIVEPDSPPRSQRQRSPPSTGPKPSSSQRSQISHVPGAFDDDLDFAATVAAGLQDTGFDPNIVINDPKFRKRGSPPGSNEPGLYRAPYAETVSDLGSVMRGSAPARDGQGFVVGEVATMPKDWPTISPDEEDTSSKLSKKEQKKREKAKRQSSDFAPVEEGSRSKEIVEEPEPYFETKLSKKGQKKRDKEARRQGSQADDVTPLDDRPVATEIVDEPESYFDEPKKKSKKLKKNSSSYIDDAGDASRDGRKVSVPVDAFDDLRNGEDEWSETKKSKRKSKRDSERYDSPSRPVPSDITSPLERTSSLSKRSKDKSKRKSDSYEPEPTEVSLPPSTPSEISRDGDFNDLRSTRKSTSTDSAERGESRSVVSADASRYDDDEARKSKRKSKSRDDFDDTRSVASAPVGDDYDDKKSKKKEKDKKNSGGFFGLFGSKSEVGATDDTPKRSKDDFEDIKKKSKNSKRSSMPDASGLYGDSGAQSVGDLSQNASNGNSNGNGAHHLNDDQDRDKWDETRKKSRTRDESESSNKDSFLAKAGTLGAGVGLAGAAVAIAAQRHQQSNADNAYESNETAEHIRSRGSSQSRQMDEILDPEITQRQFRPSIDPQYGDLLPLPPSDPVSPNVDPIDDLPDLPDSRPETPETDRLSRERAMASVRKSVYDTTPMKSPSHSAVPLKFMMGNRSNPSSPGAVRSSPLQSPSTPAQESLQFPRFRPRPTSWDSTKEYKPLYLVESNRRGSNVQQQEIEAPLPALPPSQRTSRSSSQQDSSDDATFEDAEQYPRDMEVRFAEPLSIDTILAKAPTELLDSQQSTPKARVFQYLDADQSYKQLPGHKSINIPYSSSLPAHRSVSPEPEEYHDILTKTAAEAVDGPFLVSSIGYVASSPIQKLTDKSFLNQLPSHSGSQRQPSPVDPMTKDRSSYLLRSSPMSRKTDDDVTFERVEDSPTSRQQQSHLAEGPLYSIQERDGNEALEQSSGIHPSVKQERERTLDTLSGSLRDESALQETTHDDEKEMLPLQERDAGAIDTRDVGDPDEDFVFTKSKKDKKKDKKKGRGSRSSTQDDVTLPGTSQETFEEPLAPVEAEPTEEFSLPKSKKDKKKGKLSRSSTQDDFSFEEPSREITDEPSTSANLEPTEELSMPKSKKNKKKDKKRGKSVTAWEPEEESSVPTPDKSFDTTANVNDPEEAIAQVDFVAADTKKGRKNDKKNRKSMTSREAEEEHSSSAQFEEPAQMTSREIIETAVPIGLGIAAYRELKSSETPANSSQHEGQMVPESQESKKVNVFAFQDPEKPSEVTMGQPTVSMDALEEEPASEFTRDLSRDADREMFHDILVPEDFTPSTSKKTQRKKGKSLSTWEPEVEQEVALPPVQEAEAADAFVVAGSKKGKKKAKKSQSWNPEEVVLSVQAESGELPLEPTDGRQSPQAKSYEQPVDESDQYATPGWPATPATPWATANEEVSYSSRTDYFPSPVALHSPAKPQSSDDTKYSGYFPAAEAMLPVEAAGAATLAADDLDKEADNNVAPETSISRDLESGPPQSIEPGIYSLPVPDGLKAGYDNDQLSLARQLQEEFGSGSKKSKKDKKKRQSLPATPDLDISRSRDPNEAPEDHHRARSLSIRPSHAERLVDRPTSEDRKNVYSEDQLELARQLKAEFEGGNKKSKKDKKKRQSLSRTSTQDDPAFDQPTKELQSIEPETIEDVTPRDVTPRDAIETTRDGFDAGYQEDQLSLARQLQAEFVSGSKKSKKDKKRRSTSHTPTQEPEPQTDYFGDTAQLLAEDTSRHLEGADAPGSIILNKESTRDGLAVGYNEDQLELGRQLKEEFSSGSKKSKKDKKNRQSLLRSTTEDDFSSDYPPKDENESRDIDLQNATVTELRLSEPTAAEPEDEFAFTSKKSKKDKKGKKLESLVPPAIEDEVPEGTITRDVAEVANAEASIGVEPSELPAETPEDEFSLTKKKSKKDKKGKKRDILLRRTTDDASSSDNFGKAVEALHNTHEEPSEKIGPSGKQDLAPFEDDWSSTPKNSKKDKKKRQSLAAQDDSWDQQAAEGDSAQFQASEETSTADVTAVSSANEASHETTDDFGFSTKKSKKDKKKRQSLLRSSSTFDDTSEAHIEETNLPQESTHQDIAADPPALNPALADEQDGFEFTSKKSKKDRKKRQSTQQSFLADEGPRDFDESSSAKQDPHVIGTPRNEIQEPIVETANPGTASHATNLEDKSLEQPPTEPAEEYPEAHFENFAFTTKKSKKDKKKRKDSSAPESDEPWGVSTPIGPIEEASTTIAEPSLPTQRIPEQVEASEEPSRRDSTESLPAEVVTEDILVDPADEWGTFSTKTSKKDKKTRKSSVSTPSEEIPLENEIATNTNDLADAQEPKEVSTSVADTVEDVWGSFTTMKSKKDKKNHKSGLSAPIEDTPMQTETISAQEPIDVEAPKDVSGQVEDDWDSFTSKKSKKDKKKNKSDLSTPLAEIAPETEIIEQRDVAGIKEQKLEKLEDAVDEEWGSFKTKKSKKDKKKYKSGLSTPLEMLLDPEATTSKEIVNEPTPQFEETSAEPDLTSQSEFQETEELKPKPGEEIDDEWGYFTTKKFKKDKNKNKSGVSTPLETLAETSTTQQDNPQSEEPKSQLEELLAGGAFTTKKSKEEKNKSDFSVPREDASQPEPGSEELQRNAEVPKPQQQKPLVEPETTSYQASRNVLKSETQDPVDEWDNFTTKKSKKGKKGNFGASTPLERDPQPEFTSQEDQVNEEVMPQQSGEEEEEWGSFTTKKSKKDKKRKSGLSTPIEEIPQPEVTSRDAKLDSSLVEVMLSPEASNQRDLIETEEPQSQLSSTEHDFLNSQADQAPQEDEEPFEFTTKKSKRDKKRKSGLSTPVEEIVPFVELESSHIQSRESQKQESRTSPTEPEAENDQDPAHTPFDFVTKKPKKDKKKRKSGLSTPIEELLPLVEPAYTSWELGFDVPTTQPLPIERDVSEYDSQLLPPETADDGFEFTTKKSKKDKKGKRASRVNSESDPSSSATPSISTPQVVVSAENQAHLVSERLTQSPLPVEKDLSTEYNKESDLSSKVEREAPVETQLNENDDFPLDLGRKPSKTDKRKRQATVPNINDDPGQTPLTSWADDVEEAEVEREVPVIQDIAKDESLSHIASTTEAAPIDDFSRPTKKGKKGKKRNSGLTRESSLDDSLPAPIGEDLTVQKTAEHSDIPILAATGAALAGASFLASKPVEDRHEPSKSIDDSETIRKDADMPTPTKKLSKREKRKQSIDRRAPRADPFDDPTLWEDAKPRAFEESKEENDDAGSDGFWSAPNRDGNIPSEEPLQAPKSLHEGPVDLFAPPTEQIPEIAQGGGIHSYPLSDLPKPEEQWNDLPDEYVITSSKKDKKKKKQSRLAAWETPQEELKSKEIDLPISHLPSEPPRTRVEAPRIMEHASSERPATPPNNFVEESPVDRDLSFQDDQFRPRSSLRYSRQGSSGLPIVREESPAQMDQEHFKPPSYTHYTDDFNRDSAFVTDSPIPGQRPFSDEHIRDSGVHLRESSPLERTVAPVSTSDDAIARLSWPAVDEASETVDLHRLQRPKSGMPTIQHGDEKGRSVEGYHSHTPHAEDRHSHESLAMEEDNLHRHHEDRDLLPSQKHKEESHTDLHRTQIIRRSPISEDGRPRRHRVHRSHEPEDEKPHRHAEERYPSSQEHEEEEKLPRHRIHRSHESEKGKSDKHRGEDRSHPLQSPKKDSPSDLHRTQTIHRSQPDSLVKQRVQRIESPDFHRSHTSKEDKYRDLNTSQRPKAEKPKTTSDNAIGTAAAIAGATVGFAAARQVSRENRPESGQSQQSSSNINRLRTPDPKNLRPESVGSNRSSGTPPLRRSDRKSGDLRSLSQRSNLDLAKEAELAAITAAAVEASTTAPPANPQANEGRVRAKEMADVYDGFGEGRMGSPRSPTRPHSMRRRQSMQVLDLEQRLEQLAAENRLLADAKAQADRALQTTQHASSALVERDAELDSLKRTLAWLQNEVTRLTEVNDGLTSANITLGNQQNDRYNSLESQHAQATRELQEVRDSHNNLSHGMEGIVRNEIQNAVEDKDREIAELRAQLEAAKEQIREMQRQILESKAGDGEFLTIRDEDYFDNACQQLCQHVQQWVLRFSKFSDMRACRLTSEINNDKIIDRLDNAILDGSDVDSHLADRVKRRDVFMSMTMTMVWEFVFTRYLFGMDREQRQKLKSLEKLLSDVGPASAVHQWRATTLTLLSKREAFVQQREQDTLAVVNAVLETLTEILPPPSHLEQQIQDQLTRVMTAAVDLSIEMRTQRAEYMMLPPLQPEYDANGDLASKVSFNAALMNERSGDTVSNEELEAQKAVVRIVLFPLVVKKGDDSGEGDEEIVVCPAQVLVAKAKKQVRIFSNGSQPNNSRMSLQSSMPADYGEGSVI